MKPDVKTPIYGYAVIPTTESRTRPQKLKRWAFSQTPLLSCTPSLRLGDPLLTHLGPARWDSVYSSGSF